MELIALALLLCSFLVFVARPADRNLALGLALVSALLYTIIFFSPNT